VIVGVALPTATVNVVVVLPPGLVAVTVYVPEAAATEGVPLIAPVVVLNVSPAGNAGEIE
jgi:hypothetical protein